MKSEKIKSENYPALSGPRQGGGNVKRKNKKWRRSPSNLVHFELFFARLGEASGETGGFSFCLPC